VEMLAADGSGWLTGDVGEQALTSTVEELLARPEQVDELIASGAPRRAYAKLTDRAAFCAEYLEAAATRADATGGAKPSVASRTDAQPLVSVVIPYFRLDRFITDTVRSVFEQEHRRVEVIVVNDGSTRPDDEILAELATRFPIRVLTQENAGLGRARNAGIAQSRGSYVLPLDADNMLRPSFIRRCLDILEREPDVAYATTWSQYVDEHGREWDGIDAGDGTAVRRKRIFDLGHWYSPDLTSYEDWQLYRELHHARLYGRVIPERLLLYRVRQESMVREVGLREHGRLFGEMNAHLREKEMAWASRSG
jgi:glycogen(starch) synthase